jgi:hypothetical protein
MAHLTTASRWARIGIGGACLAVGLGLAAGPALGALSDDEGQPPPGSHEPKTTDFVPEGQPPAGSSVPNTTDFVPGTQPANDDPEPPTGLTSQNEPDEPGAANPAPQADEGDPDLSSPPE